jgi:hypothetical protein
MDGPKASRTEGEGDLVGMTRADISALMNIIASGVRELP